MNRVQKNLKQDNVREEHTYDNGDYLSTIDFGATSLDFDLTYDDVTNQIMVGVYHHTDDKIGEFSIPVDPTKIPEGVEEPEMNANNGVISILFSNNKTEEPEIESKYDEESTEEDSIENESTEEAKEEDTDDTEEN